MNRTNKLIGALAAHLHTEDSAAIADSLENQTLRSERLRMAIIAAIVALFALNFLVAILFFHSIVEQWFKGELSAPLVLAGALVLVAYELAGRRVMGHMVRMRKTPHPFWKWGNALVETSIPTLMIVVARPIFGPVNVLDLPPIFAYSFFVVLSTLRLGFAISFFTGLVAGVEYLLIALLFLHGLPANSADSFLLAPVPYVIRAWFLILSGLLAGIVARQLRRQLLRSITILEDRNRVVSMFGQHVSPAVVDRLLSQTVDLGGEVNHVCLMFLDIRNFTAYSEQESPIAVVAFLNSLFDFMIESVNKHQGIVNKFLGDGFMAVFGAPIPDRLNCQHAYDASLEILVQLEQFNKDRGENKTRIGIGLHAGEAVTGNVGSAARKEYTIIGDTVNIAARIEQLNKTFGSQLLISEAVLSELEAVPSSSESLGEVTVKGHETPVSIYRLA